MNKDTNSNKEASFSKIGKIIKDLCDEMGFESEFLDQFHYVLWVNFGKNFHTFIANNPGLNDEVVRKLCNDKYYSFVLLKDVISFPKTTNFIDPFADEIYQGQAIFDSYSEVVDEIVENHQLPVLVKANNLSRGINIFKCENREQVLKAVKAIFNQQSKDYGHVLISQDFVEIEEEYRVVVYDQKIQFAYKKDLGGIAGKDAKFVGNLSPLHWENSKAVLVGDEDELGELDEFIKPIYSKMKLMYGGIDIIRDKSGRLQLIEINSQPGFNYFIRDNSGVEVKKMYRKILQDLAGQAS